MKRHQLTVGKGEVIESGQVILAEPWWGSWKVPESALVEVDMR